MSDENNKDDQSINAHSRTDGASPEPPPSWKSPKPDNEQLYVQSDQHDFDQRTESPQPRPSVNMPTSLSNADVQLLETARKFISIAQICAIVSLFLGGVVLSSIAVILSFMGMSKLNAYANAHSLDEGARRALRRPGVLAVGMCVFALVFNIMSLIFLYPIVMESLQSGDFTGLFGSGQGSAPSSGAGTSTWG